MKTVVDFATTKHELLSEHSFVPHQGVQVYHTDGSFFSILYAFVEKVRYNNMVYLVIYSKNNGFFVYDLEDLESYQEFNIAVPSTLNTTLTDGPDNEKPTFVKKIHNFVRKILCLQ